MKVFYNGCSLKSGIYKIVNTHSNRVYIGQAKRFKSRWQAHSASLISGKHQNKFLRNDFNKCFNELKHDEFIEFHILEVMEGSTKEQRNEKEEFYIKEVKNQGNCYNFRETIRGSEPSQRILTEDQKKYRSELNKKMWSDPLKKSELCEKIKKGLNQPESKKIRSEKTKAQWGNPNSLLVLSNKDRSNRDLSCIHTPEVYKKIGTIIAKDHGKIISPEGEIFDVHNLLQFVLNLGFERKKVSNFYKVITGDMPSYKGWRPYSENMAGTKYINQLTEQHFHAKKIKLRSPEGEIIESPTQTKFCRQYHMSERNLRKLLKGEITQYKGWTKVDD